MGGPVITSESDQPWANIFCCCVTIVGGLTTAIPVSVFKELNESFYHVLDVFSRWYQTSPS